MSRFDHITYDETSRAHAQHFKGQIESLDAAISKLQSTDSIIWAKMKLEETHLWIGKAIKDDQEQRMCIEKESLMNKSNGMYDGSKMASCPTPGMDRRHS